MQNEAPSPFSTGVKLVWILSFLSKAVALSRLKKTQTNLLFLSWMVSSIPIQYE